MRLAARKTLAKRQRSVKGVVFASRQAYKGGDDVPATVLSTRNHNDILESEFGHAGSPAESSNCSCCSGESHSGAPAHQRTNFARARSVCASLWTLQLN